MANYELYDYISDATADVDVILSVNPQAVLKTQVSKNQIVRRGDDGSREVLNFSSDPIPYFFLRYDLLDEEDKSTIFDIYMNESSANGKLNSFKFSHPDGHFYICSFETDITMLQSPTSYSFDIIKLYVHGRITDV